jgi:hypothetical protein
MSTRSALRYEAALKVTGSAVYDGRGSGARHVARGSRGGANQLR